MSRMSQLLRALCVTAFTSVAVSTMVPTLTHAAGEDARAVPATSATPLPPGAMAVVNGVTIPQSFLDTAVRAAGTRAALPDTPQLRAALKHQLIARELLIQGAQRANYGSRPEVQRAAPNDRANVEVQSWLHETLHPAAVTDAQVKARYDTEIVSLGKDKYKPAVIAVSNEASARTILSALRAGQPFDALARQYSIGPTKESGGAMPWLSFRTPVTEGHTNGVPLALATTLAQLQPGTTAAQPVRSGDVWLIVRLDGKRPMQTPTFDQVKDVMRKQMQVEAQQVAVNQLTAELARTATIQE